MRRGSGFIFGEMRQHLRIDGVGFGQPPARAGELVHMPGIQQRYRQLLC